MIKITVYEFDSTEEYEKFFHTKEKTAVPEQPAKAEAPKEEKPAAPSIVDVRNALYEVNKKTGKNTAKELIQGMGFENLSKVPEDKYAVLLEAVKNYAG